MVTSPRSQYLRPSGRELLATANVLISGSGQIITYHADRLGPLVETQPVANPARR